jgi:hypothetical protein
MNSIPARLSRRAQPRPDCYQPLTNAAWVRHRIVANNKLHQDAFR